MLNRLGQKVRRLIGPDPQPVLRIELEPAPPGRPRVIVDSLPKSGTHLLGKLVAELGFDDSQIMVLNENYVDFTRKGDLDGWEPIRAANLQDVIQNPLRIRCDTREALARIRPGQYCTSHLKYSEKNRDFLEKNNYKHIFIVRDLRDCLRSWVEYLINLRSHHCTPKWYYYLTALGSDEERLLTVMEGKDRFLEPYSDHIEYGAGWVDDPHTLVTRFEDLVGPSGGGDRGGQTREIARIADFLELTLDDEQIASVADRLWGGKTRTMNRGRIGSWNECFSPRIEERFWEIYGPYMATLGYPVRSPEDVLESRLH